VRQEDKRARKVLKQQSSSAPPFYVLIYVATIVIVAVYSGKTHSLPHLIPPFPLSVPFAPYEMVSQWLRSTSPQQQQQQQQQRPVYCPGRIAGVSEEALGGGGEGPKWTLAVEPAAKVHPVDRGVDVKTEALALVRYLTENAAGSQMACMHEFQHGRPRSLQVCVLRRVHGGQMTPMLNPSLRGYSDENASAVVMESSLYCFGHAVAKLRRNLVDVDYVTLTGHSVRVLLDEPAESHAFQRLWEEMRGTYECGEGEE
jgi:hypothetical protein